MLIEICNQTPILMANSLSSLVHTLLRLESEIEIAGIQTRHTASVKESIGVSYPYRSVLFRLRLPAHLSSARDAIDIV